MTLLALKQLIQDPAWGFVAISENNATSDILRIRFFDNKQQEVRKALLSSGYVINWTNGVIVDMGIHFTYK